MSAGFPCIVAALDVGGTKIAGGLVEYEAAGSAPVVRQVHTVPTQAARGGNAVLQTLCTLASKLVDEAKAAGTPVCGIGVSTAGRVDAPTGSIAFANDLMPGWTGQPVAATLRDCCKVPVAVLNDVQGYALGEARWGAAHGADTCIMVAAGTGLGGAIIAHGSVLRGSHGFAGELGHTLHPAAAHIPCVCGGESHLESIAAGSGIEACYAAAGGDTLTGAQIAERANAGEALGRRIIEQAGFALGESIAAWANMLDPDCVILAGSVCKAGPLWRDALQRGFEHQMPALMQTLPIVDAVLQDKAPLIGGAENLLDFLEEGQL